MNRQRPVPYEYTHGYSPYMRVGSNGVGYEVYVMGKTDKKPGLSVGVLQYFKPDEFDSAVKFINSKRAKTESLS